jgi:hypothetical protein
MDYKVVYLARRNPTITPEDWPRTWRSHAVYCSQFPAVGASIRHLLYCNRTLNATLDGKPFAPPELNQDFDGSAVVASDDKALWTLDVAPDLKALVDADELRIFTTYARHFSLNCQETFNAGSGPSKVAVLRFLARKPSLSSEAFEAKWQESQAELAAKAASADSNIVHYVHDRVRMPPPAGYEFEAIVETWFTDAESAMRSFSNPALSAAFREYDTLSDPARNITLLTHTVHRYIAP